MRNRTIWESANRPLFVRSVWNQTCGGYRHFILDNGPKYKSYDLMCKQKRVIFRPTTFGEPTNREDILQLVGSIKPQNRPTPFLKIPKPASNNIRTTVNTAPKTFFDFLRKRGAIIKEDPASKRSSLQNLNVDNNNTTGSDEKLAERVLNWLDLAGKTPLLRPNTAPDNHFKKSSPIKRENNPFQQQIRTTAATKKRPESVKHITIIFDKEGIPVRYNRPIKYTDLFRIGLTTSSRKFVSTAAAAARFKKFVETGDTMVSTLPGNGAFDKAAMDLKRTKNRVTSVKKGYENDYRSLINRKILEESCNLHEMKKQLHIFMPSLPKKTNLIPADCASSLLSGGGLSEQSKS